MCSLESFIEQLEAEPILPLLSVPKKLHLKKLEIETENSEIKEKLMIMES